MHIVWPVHRLEEEHSQYPGIMTIAAVLREGGFRNEVVPADLDSVERALDGCDDAVLAFSTTTTYSRRYLELNRALKTRRPEVFTVFGGAHPTFFPQMVDEHEVDAVCVGEGELPMLELATALAERRSPREIANLWVKEGGAVHRNPVRPLIEDLDRLPLPARDLFAKHASDPHLSAIVMTGRGCPYHCTYCYNHVYHRLYEGKGRVVRRRSVDHVIRELAGLKAQGCGFIRFMDDVFILDRDWVLEFSSRYRAEVGLPFTCLVRANLVTEETVRALKAAGCHRMMMGVEAGSEELRRTVLKRQMSDEQILAAGRIIREAGIRLVTANILAIPGGTLDDDWDTVDLNLRVRPSYASASVMQAFPGTEIHDIAAELGLLQEDNLFRLEHGEGFGFSTALKHRSEADRRQVENLHKFFPLIIWLPWLRPLVRLLIRLPPNRAFEAVYMASVNIGSNLVAIPARVGVRILARKVLRGINPWRRRRATAAAHA